MANIRTAQDIENEIVDLRVKLEKARKPSAFEIKDTPEDRSKAARERENLINQIPLLEERIDELEMELDDMASTSTIAQAPPQAEAFEVDDGLDSSGGGEIPDIDYVENAELIATFEKIIDDNDEMEVVAQDFDLLVADDLDNTIDAEVLESSTVTSSDEPDPEVEAVIQSLTAPLPDALPVTTNGLVAGLESQLADVSRQQTAAFRENAHAHSVTTEPSTMTPAEIEDLGDLPSLPEEDEGPLPPTPQ